MDRKLVSVTLTTKKCGRNVVKVFPNEMWSACQDAGTKKYKFVPKISEI
jgi:predicted  nucleic acid-binding Zn-ribbon protein